MPKALPIVEISIPDQTLVVRGAADDVLFKTEVSTARKGPGERINSECTPRGLHVIRAKIGSGAAMNAVFVSRRPTGEIYSRELSNLYPDRDWILTRILWLSGLEPGKNRFGEVDTMRRYIYIHGAPDEDPMGVPGSHGCVKMRNHDVVTLFDMVEPGVQVNILG